MIIDFCFVIFVILPYFAGNDGLWDDNNKINEIMIFVLLSLQSLFDFARDDGWWDDFDKINDNIDFFYLLIFLYFAGDDNDKINEIIYFCYLLIIFDFAGDDGWWDDGRRGHDGSWW